MKIHLHTHTIRNILIILVLVFFAQNLNAQNTAKEKLEAEKVAFFTRHIGLTAKEAQQFWPLYNEYQNKLNQINKERKTTSTYYKQNKGNISEAESETILNRYIEYQEKETELLKTYTKQFQTILPAEKVMQVFITEIEFRKYLLNLLREEKVNMNIRDNR